MARIDTKDFKHCNLNRNSIHAAVPAKYTSFESLGRKFVQINTYGRQDRKHPETASQEIQFDKEAAQRLIEIFRSEFDLRS